MKTNSGSTCWPSVMEHWAMAVCTLSIILLAVSVQAGTIEIPAWAFSRGNVVIDAEPAKYADAGPVVVSGEEMPWGWRVQYDVEYPVAGKYQLFIRYAATEARPVEVLFDTRNVSKICTRIGLDPDTGAPSAKSSGAASEILLNYFGSPDNLSMNRKEKAVAGKHTIILASTKPLPNLVSLRLTTPEPFPEDWQPLEYKVKDLASVPKKFHKHFTQPQTDVAALRLPVPEPRLPGAKGTIKIPAWTFDRGNVDIYADPNKYANAGPLVGGPEEARQRGKDGESVVEYDVEVPVAGDYILKARYASPEARPVEAFMNGRHLGRGFDHATFGTAPGELPIRLEGHSRAARARPEEVFGGFEEPVVFALSEGKQTLKLTRRGPLPNFMDLSLCSTTASFPKGWKQAERKMKHMDCVAPELRASFLPEDAVNVAALRLAIEDTIKTYGAKYPAGRKYLDSLASLEAEQVVAETAGTNEAARVESALQSLRSEAMFAHPELNFDKLLFLKTGEQYGHTYSDQHSHGTNGNICVLSPVKPGGQVTELMPELDGGRFDRFDLSFDAKKMVFGYSKSADGKYSIYEVGIDPETARMIPGSLRRLTSFEGDGLTINNENARDYVRLGIDDMDPIYLPDGRFMFASTRCSQTVFCAPGSVTSLYTMDADGKNMRRITQGPINETSPSVMNDGRVIYTRWEYVDKGLGNGQALWAIRPDGSGSDHIFKNNTVWPAGMSAARSIPGSSSLITIGGSHHHAARGSVILVDNRRTRIGVEPMTTITPEIGYHCMDSGSDFGNCYDPYPLSEKFYLVSKDGVLYVMDMWGNRAVLYRDPNPTINCFEPFPLRPRRKPATLTATPAAPTPAAKKQPGTMFVQDVYQGMTGIERGRVKYLRVMGVLPWPWSENGMGWVGPDVHRKRVYGIAKVHEDGSACFEVPAEENVFFQALDENYRMLQHMPTFLNLMPGENRSCIGCHEPRRKAPPQVAKRPQALDHPAQALMPLPGDTGPRAIHYMTDVQPILDKRCISCHSGDKAEAGLVLIDEPTHDRNRSYENLMGRGLVSYMNDAYGRAHYRPEPPLTWGSNRSKLVERLSKEPCASGITMEELVRITTWNDANIPFYGTYRGRRELKYQDEPDFRLPPLALK